MEHLAVMWILFLAYVFLYGSFWKKEVQHFSLFFTGIVLLSVPFSVIVSDSEYQLLGILGFGIILLMIGLFVARAQLSYVLLLQILILGIWEMMRMALRIITVESDADRAFIYLVCMMLFFIFAPTGRMSDFLKKCNYKIALLIINLFITVSWCSFIIHMEFNAFVLKGIWSVLILSLILLVNGDIVRNQILLEQKVKELMLYQTYLPVVENLISEIRGKQHDYRNQLQSIRSLAYTINEFDELQTQLLNQIGIQLQKQDMDQLLKLSNPLLAGFLISKKAEALEKGINTQIIIHNYNIDTIIPDTDLIDMIGVLMDNAIEASGIGDDIYCEIGRNNNRLHIEIKNPGPVLNPEFVKKIFQKGYTDKTPSESRSSLKRGYGLYNLRKKASQYDSVVELSNDTIGGSNYLVFTLETQ